MEVGEVDKQQAIIYLTVLAVLEVLLIIFTIASSQQSLITFNILRILLLVGAHCLKNIAWAAYYTAFALITALYVFDPVGLWITGRKRYMIQMDSSTQALKTPSPSSSFSAAEQQW
jgi:flagellar biosynthesis protein FliP